MTVADPVLNSFVSELVTVNSNGDIKTPEQWTIIQQWSLLDI